MKRFIAVGMSAFSIFAFCAHSSQEIKFSEIKDKFFVGSQPISIFRLNLKGFYMPSSSVRITHLKSVEMTTDILSWVHNFNGTNTDILKKPEFLITLTLDDADAVKFSKFSESAFGNRVLLEINSKPIVAPIMGAKIEGRLQITFRNYSEAQEILTLLKPFTKTIQTEQDAAANP